MTTSKPSLNPRETPWKRGDVVRWLGSSKIGFVLNHTAEYLEVRWGKEGVVEKLAVGDAANVVRIAHADSPTATGTATNAEALKDLEALSHLENAIRERMKTVKSQAEKEELDKLVERSYQPKCAFDRKYHSELLTLAIAPGEVTWHWKLRERWHRWIHHH